MKTGPVTWRDEGPQTPYSPTVRWGGSMVTAAPPPSTPMPVSPERIEQLRESSRRYYEANKERMIQRQRERRAARKAARQAA